MEASSGDAAQIQLVISIPVSHRLVQYTPAANMEENDKDNLYLLKISVKNIYI